jgi:hypothetical protein
MYLIIRCLHSCKWPDDKPCRRAGLTAAKGMRKGLHSFQVYAKSDAVCADNQHKRILMLEWLLQPETVCVLAAAMVRRASIMGRAWKLSANTLLDRSA